MMVANDADNGVVVSGLIDAVLRSRRGEIDVRCDLHATCSYGELTAEKVRSLRALASLAGVPALTKYYCNLEYSLYISRKLNCSTRHVASNDNLS